MPKNTICVDRTSKLGNPFIVGGFGTKQECIDAHRILLTGRVCLSCKSPSLEEQKKYYSYVKENIRKLKGKNMACYCKEGTPCHADVLLEIANS